MTKGISREGHRQRLRDSYIENGISAMPAHNVLELLLTYSIPRRDVKLNAYSLLNSFDGKLERVFDADFNELKETQGTGEHSAALIKLFREIFNRLESPHSGVTLDNYIAKKDFASNILSDYDGECYMVLFAGNSGDVTSYITFPQEAGSPPPNAKSIVEGVIKNNAAAVIIAHKNSGNYYEPQDSDIELIKSLADLFSVLKIRFDDYIMVGENGSLSLANDVRYYMYLDHN